MMIARRRSCLCFAALFLCLYARYARLSRVYDGGMEIFVPVAVEADEYGGFPYAVSLRYGAVVPPRHILSFSGTVVVEREENGTVVFIRNHQSGEPLKPQELLLRYDVSGGPDAAARVDFSSSSFPFYTKERRRAFMQTARKNPVRYAVLRVDAAGRALLRGFADNDGAAVTLPPF